MQSSIMLGVALCLVGLAGYLGTGRKSPTALIPLFFGLIFAALGYAGEQDGVLGKVSLGLAVLGFLGTARSFLGLAKGERGAATLSKAAMAGLCLWYLLSEML